MERSRRLLLGSGAKPSDGDASFEFVEIVALPSTLLPVMDVSCALRVDDDGDVCRWRWCFLCQVMTSGGMQLRIAHVNIKNAVVATMNDPNFFARVLGAFLVTSLRLLNPRQKIFWLSSSPPPDVDLLCTSTASVTTAVVGEPSSDEDSDMILLFDS